MSSRSVCDLLPELQILFNEFSMLMHDLGLQFMLICTYRSQEEQDATYAQGRTKQGKIVTWTRHSRHTDRRAFDIAMLDKTGKINWNGEAYKEAGSIGKSVGLVWGGDWEKPDPSHFQLPDNKREV